MKKLILLIFVVMFSVSNNAQNVVTDTIKEMPIADRTGQLLSQYIDTHTMSEMDGDTVTLVNVYNTIGYSFNDKYLGIVTQTFIVPLQDIVFEDSSVAEYKEMFYIPMKPGIYELTKFDQQTAEKKLGYKFVLNGNNNFFVRKDRFVVRAEYDYGKKKVTFHCLTYPKRYVLDFSKK